MSHLIYKSSSPEAASFINTQVNIFWGGGGKLKKMQVRTGEKGWGQGRDVVCRVLASKCSKGVGIRTLVKYLKLINKIMRVFQTFTK